MNVRCSAPSNQWTTLKLQLCPSLSVKRLLAYRNQKLRKSAKYRSEVRCCRPPGWSAADNRRERKRVENRNGGYDRNRAWKHDWACVAKLWLSRASVARHITCSSLSTQSSGPTSSSKHSVGNDVSFSRVRPATAVVRKAARSEGGGDGEEEGGEGGGDTSDKGEDGVSVEVS